MKMYDNINIVSPKIKGKISPQVVETLELNEIYYSISKIIIEYRKENNLTQKQLAQKLGVNQTMISKIESGKYNPTFKLIYTISRKLTETTNMFKDTLREILKYLDEVDYRLNIKIIENSKEQEYKIREYYKNSKNIDNVIYIKNYYCNQKGDTDNGKITSKYTVNG